MADAASYIAQFLRLNARTAFALAAAGVTVIALRQADALAADSSDMWIAYGAAFGFWLLIGMATSEAYRRLSEYRTNRPDYSIWKAREWIKLREASQLLASQKPGMALDRDANAWYGSLRDVVAQNGIEFNNPRVGMKTGWPDADSKITRDELRKAVKLMNQRVPRWLR